MNTRRLQRTGPGFTLIEMIISVSLMAMIVVSAYLCLNACVAGQKLIEPRVEIIQNARVALAILTADLRDACTLSQDFEFLGMHRVLGDVEADNLDFATHNYTPSRPREGDFCQESFYLDKDPDTGEFILYRRRNPTIAVDPLSGGSREEIATGLVGLKFEYFDGIGWYDTWGDPEGKQQNSQREEGNLAGLPEAVRITLLFDSDPRTKKTTPPDKETPGPPPLVFQTVARLNLADASSPGSSSSSSSDSGGANTGQMPPGGGN